MPPMSARKCWPRWPSRFARLNTSRSVAAFAIGSGRSLRIILVFSGQTAASDSRPGWRGLGHDPGLTGRTRSGQRLRSARFNAHLLQVALARITPNFEPTTWGAFERVWLENRPVIEVAQEWLSVVLVYVAKSRVLKQLRAEVSVSAEDIPTAYSLEES